MNVRNCKTVTYSLLLRWIIVAAPLSCWAQLLENVRPSLPPNGGVSVPPGVAAHDPRKANAEAKALINGNNINGAEEKLVVLNASKVDTSAWHFETAQRLVHLAEEMSREGNRSGVNALINQSLVRLEQAALVGRAERESKAEASAKTLAGRLHERYRGDITAALASYRSALLIDPNDAGAKEALQRLERASAMLQARFNSQKKR
jgi:hypothetical protein